MSTQSISYSCVLPCFCSPRVEQTDGLCAARTVAVAIAVISALIGILILSGVPSLNNLGTTAGAVFIAGGSLLFLVGLCLHCGPKKPSINLQTLMGQQDYSHLRREWEAVEQENRYVDEQIRQAQVRNEHNKTLLPSVEADLKNKIAEAFNSIPSLDPMHQDSIIELERQNEEIWRLTGELHDLRAGGKDPEILRPQFQALGLEMSFNNLTNPKPPTQPSPAAKRDESSNTPISSSDQKLEETRRLVQKLTLVDQLTTQLERAVKDGQVTDAIEKQLLNEGISAKALAEKIACLIAEKHEKLTF
jgi:hypothetical protein